MVVMSVFLDESRSPSKLISVEELIEKAEAHMSGLPTLRYGDTSPYKCRLLHNEDGYYTVITENGDIIQDIAGWFKPWDAMTEKKGGETIANECEPAHSGTAC